MLHLPLRTLLTTSYCVVLPVVLRRCTFTVHGSSPIFPFLLLLSSLNGPYFLAPLLAPLLSSSSYRMSHPPQLSNHNLLCRAISDTVGPNKIHFILWFLSPLGCCNPSEGYNRHWVLHSATLFSCIERSGIPLACYDYEAIRNVLSHYIVLQEDSVSKRSISRAWYKSKTPKPSPVLRDYAEISLPTTSFNNEFVPSSLTYDFHE
jgi:hypothetical protein